MNPAESPALCRTCGTPLPGGEWSGICPRCLIKALNSQEQADDAMGDPPSQLAAELLFAPEVPSVVGKIIGHYEVAQRIGSGGMGEVYLATDIRSARKAALKLLPLRFAASAERFQRFQREARAVIALNHPNILTVYEIGEEDSAHYIVSELIEGETLRARLSRGPLELAEAIDVAAQVASALGAAHKAGIVHRDIKPENIMLRSDGYVKVLDFGLAKLAEQELPLVRASREAPGLLQTSVGSTIGTLHYMSPEQTRGDAVDERTDIWSLGVVFYEMVTGSPPFTGKTPKEITDSILQREPPAIVDLRRDAPTGLQQIVSTALKKDREERYPRVAEMLEALKNLRRRFDLAAELAQSHLPRRTLWKAAAVLAALFVIGSIVVLKQTNMRPDPMAQAVKSIAVLPFENLSEDKANAYFTDGVQDEILTTLAKVADLKVISRTSVMQFRDTAKRNLPEIAQALKVSYVLEGSVQRSANRVRVSAQLIDARTDTHLWAERYDRDLADVFAIQSEIAKAIAGQLQAKLSPREKTAIEQRPTSDLEAHELYVRAGPLIDLTPMSQIPKDNLLQAVDLLNQALARDPAFVLAYCKLANAHDSLYLLGLDHTAARLAMADAAVNAALRLRPDSGDAHLALARHLYSNLDYDRALAELEIARSTLPNDPRIYELGGDIDRRQGRWSEGARNLERALELDPRNVFLLDQLAVSYKMLRSYPEEIAALDRALVLKPDDPDFQLERGFADLQGRADTRRLHNTIATLLAKDPGFAKKTAPIRLFLALCERDTVAAEAALAALGDGTYGPNAVQFSRPFGEGMVARMKGDDAAARAAFTQARAAQEEILRAQPDYAPALCVLGMIDAGLGRKDDALREGRRAIELLPVTKDSANGPALLHFFAVICAWIGEKDLALKELSLAIQNPGPLSYGALRLHPYWDPLRGDPRFERLVEKVLGAGKTNFSTEQIESKSIAVLPFENRSDDKANAYFAAGIQDEILTRLAKIGTLKVISRTSTERYQTAPTNVSEIAKQLGVAHLLEGSVQKADKKVRVNVQLIKAEDGSHLWAETYDRNLNDIFTVESEVATAIAEKLQAALTGSEQRALAKRPTENLDAYDAYLRGVEFDRRMLEWPANQLEAERYLKLAVSLDPTFALAWARLAKVEANLYFGDYEPTPARREAARNAAEQATQLQPELGESWVATGYFRSGCERNLELARAAFEKAREQLPNDSEVLRSLGWVVAHSGHPDDAMALLAQAIQFDPRNASLFSERADYFVSLRRFPEARAAADQALTLSPQSAQPVMLKALTFQAEGDLERANQLLASISGSPIATNYPGQARQLLLERRYSDVTSTLRPALLAERKPSVAFSRDIAAWMLGTAQKLSGDLIGSQSTFAQQRDALLREMEKTGGPQGGIHCMLALMYAATGDKTNALREAHRGLELEGNDTNLAPSAEEVLALIEVGAGDTASALARLPRLLNAHYYSWLSYTPLTPALLRIDPVWDPLRNDPQFQKLAEGKP